MGGLQCRKRFIFLVIRKKKSGMGRRHKDKKSFRFPTQWPLCSMKKAKLCNERKEVWGTFLRSITSQQRGFGDRSLHDLERERVRVRSSVYTEVVSSKASIDAQYQILPEKTEEKPWPSEQSNLPGSRRKKR